MKNDLKWEFTPFGTSTTADPEKNGFEGDAREGRVRVYSLKGSGKVVPLSMDGLSFYYTRVPSGKNFRLKARAHINTWNFSNGQEAFGVMACDRIGEPAQNDFWNNSVMTVVTKHSYGWDPVKNCYSMGEGCQTVNMFLGVSTIIRRGITSDNIELFDTKPDEAVKKYFYQEQAPLEHFCGGLGNGYYNIAANYKGSLISQASGTTPDELVQEDFILEVIKNNSGYVSRYTSADGKWTCEKLHYDEKYYDDKGDRASEPKGPGILEGLDPECVYVGFFAARNMDVTFEDIELEIRDPQEDEPTVAHEKNILENCSRFVTRTTSGEEDFLMDYLPAWKGLLEVWDSRGQLLHSAVADEDVHVYVKAKLTEGENDFKARFTPDRDHHRGLDEGHPERVHNILSSYEPLEQSLSVFYRKFEGPEVYASPDGTPAGAGTREDPVDVHTATAHARRGLKILLLDGVYILDRPLMLNRLCRGSEDEPIVFMTDPRDGGRAVLDFSGITAGGRLCGGLCVEGDYWQIENLEVRNTADIQVGVMISGAHNVIKGVTAHNCGNVGICIIARDPSDKRWHVDPYGDPIWPHHNLVTDCMAYENTDKGHDLADGFACKVFAGEGNAFVNCISHHNSDDGFDLYTKAESGPIGKVILKGCIAYMNGYIHEDGVLIEGGNGNGFKLGGEGMEGGHTLEGCRAYDNKGEGFDSNSCPDVRLISCMAWDNEKSNIHLYGRKGRSTAFYLENTVSFRSGEGMEDKLETGPGHSVSEAVGPGCILIPAPSSPPRS